MPLILDYEWLNWPEWTKGQTRFLFPGAGKIILSISGLKKFRRFQFRQGTGNSSGADFLNFGCQPKKRSQCTIKVGDSLSHRSGPPARGVRVSPIRSNIWVVDHGVIPKSINKYLRVIMDTLLSYIRLRTMENSKSKFRKGEGGSCLLISYPIPSCTGLLSRWGEWTTLQTGKGRGSSY